MRALPASAVLVACLAVATACGGDDEPAEPTAVESPSTVTSSPSAPETTEAATPDASASPATLEDRLLEPGAVPGLNAEWRWQEGETGPASAEPFGLCAQTAPGADLMSIGATEVIERTYFPPDDSDDNAGQQIAEFPDTTTVDRAWSVLKAWHKRCGRTISSDIGLDRRTVVPVDVTDGTARWYLLSWTPTGDETGRFEAFGMVRNDTRITLLRMENAGQDYNYPAGKEPMVAMIRAAAATLG